MRFPRRKISDQLQKGRIFVFGEISGHSYFNINDSVKSVAAK